MQNLKREVEQVINCNTKTWHTKDGMTLSCYNTVLSRWSECLIYNGLVVLISRNTNKRAQLNITKVGKALA